MKKLLLNGCSHTEGIPVPGPNISFGKYFKNFEEINIAVGGSSNHSIFRRTIEYCEQNEKPDLVIIGWTTHERFEFNFDGERKDFSTGKSYENEKIQKFNRYANLYMVDWQIGLENLLLYQLSLQNYLNAKKIDYIFCNMYNFVPLDCQIPMWKSIDKSKYYMPHSSFIEKYIKLYPEGFDKGQHIKHEMIYKKIAKELIEYYGKR